MNETEREQKRVADRKTREYKAGATAFAQAVTEDGCPFPIGSGDRRTLWFNGYLDARTKVRLGHIFDKYRFQWP